MKRVAPRSGSMQVWPRKRAKRAYARVRSWNKKEKGLLAFPGYKVGMTHVLATDARKTAPTKGETLALPSTILECPPVKLYSVRCYSSDAYGRHVMKEVVVGKDKHLHRKVLTKKTHKLDVKAEDYDDLAVVVMTQPSKTAIGKKKPELFEVALGGTTEEQLAWITEHLDKEIPVTEVFKEGDHADSHAITTGRGFQGPVKRFGISLKASKSEKGRRAPGSLGGWSGQQHVMYRVAHAGQTGYHQRTQYNNLILKVGDDAAEITPKKGFPHYGLVKSQYLLVKGSIQGPKKRMITLTKPIRLHEPQALPTIEEVAA